MSNKTDTAGFTSGGKLQPGSLMANTAGRALMAADYFNQATQFAKFAASPFMVTGALTSAAAATAVELIPASSIPAGKKIYVTGFIVTVGGATAWGTTATVKIQDSNASAVDFATIAVAALTNAAIVHPTTANVTIEAAFKNGTGGTAAKGLQVKGDANGTGSTLAVTVWGFVK